MKPPRVFPWPGDAYPPPFGKPKKNIGTLQGVQFFFVGFSIGSMMNGIYLPTVG